MRTQYARLARMDGDVVLWCAYHTLSAEGRKKAGATKKRGAPAQNMYLAASCNLRSPFFPVIRPNDPLVGLLLGPFQFG